MPPFRIPSSICTLPSQAAAEERGEHRRGTQMNFVNGDILQQPSEQPTAQGYCYLRPAAGRQVDRADPGYSSESRPVSS